MKTVVQRLLVMVRRRQVKVRFLLLDKGFFSVEVIMTPREIREIYRKRFGIKTSYRQMNEARIKTSTRDP